MISIRFSLPKGDYCAFVWHNVCKTAQKNQHALAKGSVAGSGFSVILAALVGFEDNRAEKANWTHGGCSVCYLILFIFTEFTRFIKWAIMEKKIASTLLKAN